MANHRWTFFRAGGFDQARLDTAQDLINLEHLDLKLWAALACPVKGLEFDERTLALVDTDNDGRVRAPEVIAAVQWCEDHLKDVAAIKAGGSSVPLAQINDTTANGKAILASARQILKDLGKGSATEIGLDDVADTAKVFAATNFNGDGIIPADAAPDAATKAVIEDIIKCGGSVTDRSGKPGVDQGRVDGFFAQCAAFAAWAGKTADPSIQPFGAGTAAAADAVKAVRAKVDDYFARCKLAAYDSRAQAALNRREEEYLTIAAADLSITAQEVAGFPLSQIEAGKALPLLGGINPAWAGAMATLHAAAVTPAYGADRTSITESEWTALCGKVAAFEAWRGGKPATQVEGLGLPRIQEIASGSSKTVIDALIAQDKALEAEFQAMGQVEKLIRFHRDLYRLLHNFVNFADFYSKDRDAIFQVGTLFLDQRACDLCVRVDDAGKHAALAGMAKCYLAYCDCTRPTGEKMQIAAAFTGGDSDFLMVGRNGVFFDRKGRDWDATITKVIDNPISVRQAFWAPYKKLVRLIEEQAAKRAAAADAEADARIAAAASATANADKAAKPPEPKKIDIGTVAALGVAFGAIGTLLATVGGGLVGLVEEQPFWLICVAVMAIMLVISGPGMFIAWLKLRQRNMGPILDANGWAVNGRVKMNVPFGGSLTQVAQVPVDAIPSHVVDPFAEKKSAWPGVLKTLVVICFFVSLGNHYGAIRGIVKASGVDVEKAEKDGAIWTSFVLKSAEQRALELEAAKAKAKADTDAKTPATDTPK